MSESTINHAELFDFMKLLYILGRADPCDLLECAAEMEIIVESDALCRLLGRRLPLREQLLRSLDTEPFEVAAHRKAGPFLEQYAVMSFAKTRPLCQHGQRQLKHIVLFDILNGLLNL